MFGFFGAVWQKRKGESQQAYNERSHKAHKEEGIARKKREGRWLPREEYERLTGRKGRD